MNSTVSALARVASDLRAVLSGDALAGLSDAERAEVLRGSGEVCRLVDAVVVEAVALADVEFGHRFGCRGMNELLQRALLTDAPSASKIVKAADLVHRDVNLVSGGAGPVAGAAGGDAGWCGRHPGSAGRDCADRVRPHPHRDRGTPLGG
jgi:hypothetical protein